METKTQHTSLLGFYLTLAVAMMTYKASTTMYKSSINTFLYNHILQNERNTDFTELVHSDNGSRVPNVCYPNHTIKSDKDTSQEKADKFQTYLLSIASILSLITLIVYGSLSDYVGRKFIFAVCISGYILQSCVAVCVIYFKTLKEHLYLAYIIDGIGGSSFGFSLACFLCVADVAKSKKDRTLGLVLIESLNGFGSITTKFSTTYFTKRCGVMYPILTSAGCCLLVLIMILSILEETNKTSQTPHTSKLCCKYGPSCCTLFKNISMFYFRGGNAHKRKMFWLCFIIFCLVESPMIFRSDLIPLLQVGWPSCWSTDLRVGYTIASLGLNYIVAMVIMKYLQNCVSETTLLYLGIASATAFNIITGLANRTVLYFIGLISGTLMILPKSIIRGIASKSAGPNYQGALFSGLIASELVCEVTSEVIYQFEYAHNHGPIDGTIFLVIAGLLFISVTLVFLLKRARQHLELSDYSNNQTIQVLVDDDDE